MYTRCPSCSSTFRVTAAILQMAAGDVRCGACGGVFNALDTLVDDWTGTDLLPPGAPRLSDPLAPVEPAAETAAQAVPAAGSEPEPESESEPVEAALEFNVPENEWQRFFITPQEAPALTPPRAEPALGEPFDDLPEEAPGAPPGAMPPPPAGEAPAFEVGALDEETADTDTWQGFLREAGLEPGPAGEPEADEADGEPLFILGEEARHSEATLVIARPGEASLPATGADRGAGREPAWDDDGAESFILEDEGGEALDEGAQAEEAAAPAEAASEPGAAAAQEAEVDAAPAAPPAAAAAAATDTVLDWGPPPPFSTRPAAGPGHAGRWLAASLVAALALGAQLLHYSRDELAASPAYGGLVRAVYGRLGLPLDPDWPLEAYEIRSVKALVENSPQGALDIAAEIAVTGRQTVGLPVLRVVLRDRWSNTVASGVFGAADYLAEAPPPSSLYAPGTLIPVQISLKDPGTAAQGFELDVCVPNRHLGLQCKAGRDPFRR